MFHIIQSESLHRDPEIDRLSYQAGQLAVSLDSLIKGYEISIDLPVLEQLRKGPRPGPSVFEASDWPDLLDKLEQRAGPIITLMGSVLEERRALEKSISEKKTTLGGVDVLRDLSVSLKELRGFQRTHAIFAVIPSKDVPEVRASLEQSVIVVDSIVSQKESVILIIGSLDASDKIDIVLKSFEVRQFELPGELPTNTKDAVQKLEDEISTLEARLSQIRKTERDNLKKHENELIALFEAVSMTQSTLVRTRNVGELVRFAVLSGYIPQDLEADFQRRLSNRAVIVFEVPSYGDSLDHDSHSENPSPEKIDDSEKTVVSSIPKVAIPSKIPTLTTNKGIVKSFEKVTLMHGQPSYGEIDPTPLITLIFPIFYGIMFADVGAGLILMLFGLFLYYRHIRDWGTILAIAGFSAMIVGMLVGEMFGFSFSFSLLGLPALELVDHHAFKFFPEVVLTLFGIAIVIGLFHLLLGYVIRIVNLVRRGEKEVLLLEALPKTLFFIFAVLLGVGLVQSGINFDTLMDVSLNLGVKIPMSIIVTLAIGSLIGLMLIKTVAASLGLIKGHSVTALIGDGALEAFEAVIQVLSNSISYVRLGIMLVVHASLVLVVNQMFVPLLPLSLPLMFFFHLLILLFEGLVVFIQTLRLHIYEWFTKFYDGTGDEFLPIAQESPYAKIKLH
ncbi:MAG: V-type ATPase 116kDa subunit family protein [Nitrososphaerales archaeon]